MGPQDLLDALDEIVYVSDPNTYELLYANRRCRSLLPTRDYKGKPCYALLQGQPAPCPYCTNARLTPDKFYVWEFNNPSMGRHFLLKDKLIDWDGRPARLEIAVDITEQELLSRDTARKLETERTLVECIRRLMDAASSREAAQAVLSCVGGFYQASHAFLLELHASGRSVHCTQMWTAADAEPLELPSISLSNGSLLNRLLESPQAQCILAERLGPEYRQVAAQMQDAGVSALLFAPLPHTFGRGLLGVANAASGINDTRVLESLAYFVGSELSRRRLQSRLEYQNRHDALTGLDGVGFAGQVHHRHAQLTAVVAVNDTDAVRHAETVLDGQAAAGVDKGDALRAGQLDGKAGGHEGALHRGQRQRCIQHRAQVRRRRAGRCVLRHNGAGIQFFVLHNRGHGSLQKRGVRKKEMFPA